MGVEPQLFFQVREDALDRQQLDPGALHPLVVGAPPETFVGDHRFARIDEVEQRLVLVRRPQAVRR